MKWQNLHLKLAKSTKSDVELINEVNSYKDNVKFKAKLLPSKVSLDEKKEIMHDAECSSQDRKNCKHNSKLC